MMSTCSLLLLEVGTFDIKVELGLEIDLIYR